MRNAGAAAFGTRDEPTTFIDTLIDLVRGRHSARRPHEAGPSGKSAGFTDHLKSPAGT
jgi:hypothetical protein